MEEVNKLINEMQAENQRLQAVLIQKQTLKMQEMEIEIALKYLETCEDDVYRSIGPILVKSNKEGVKKDLSETNDEIKLKLNSLEKQETRLKEKIKTMQEKVQGLVSRSGGQGG